MSTLLIIIVVGIVSLVAGFFAGVLYLAGQFQKGLDKWFGW